MKASTVVPILHIFEEAKAKEFYVEWLGFEIDREHRFEANLPMHMQVSRGYFHDTIVTYNDWQNSLKNQCGAVPATTIINTKFQEVVRPF